MFNYRKYKNCFFTGGSMGFKKRGDENAFIKRVNQLISLHEVDERYKKASKVEERRKLLEVLMKVLKQIPEERIILIL